MKVRKLIAEIQKLADPNGDVEVYSVEGGVEGYSEIAKVAQLADYDTGRAGVVIEVGDCISAGSAPEPEPASYPEDPSSREARPLENEAEVAELERAATRAMGAYFDAQCRGERGESEYSTFLAAMSAVRAAIRRGSSQPEQMVGLDVIRSNDDSPVPLTGTVFFRDPEDPEYVFVVWGDDRQAPEPERWAFREALDELRPR